MIWLIYLWFFQSPSVDVISKINHLIETDSFELCLAYLDKHHNEITPLQRYFYEGECYLLLEDYEAASIAYNKALQSKSTGAKSELDAKILLGLSKISRASHHSAKASDYARDALTIAQALGDSTIIFKASVILGNSYYSAEQYDSATTYYMTSLNYIDEEDLYFKAIITNNLAMIKLNTDEYSEAAELSLKAHELFTEAKKFKNANQAFINHLAAREEGNEKVNDILWNKAYAIAKQHAWLDQQSHLLNNKKNQLLKTINQPELASILDSIDQLDYLENDHVIKELNEKFQNQKLTSDLQISELTIKARNRWLYALGILLGGFGIGTFFYARYQRAKAELKLSEERLAKQTALQHERTRIASEMHDDLGGGLTTIKFLSQKLIRKMQDDQEKASLEKIIHQSQTLVNNMSEIIWAMNSGFDTLENLVAYSRRYAREYLEDHHISLQFQLVGYPSGIELTGEKRRNIFLVIKEALHNAVKHSKATAFSILFNVNDTLSITLSDNGVGLPKETHINGNGLRNMEKRVTALGGQFVIEDSSIGTTFQVSIPID